jgi:hypothetical protein
MMATDNSSMDVVDHDYHLAAVDNSPLLLSVKVPTDDQSEHLNRHLQHHCVVVSSGSPPGRLLVCWQCPQLSPFAAGGTSSHFGAVPISLGEE